MPFIFVILGIYAIAVALHGNTGALATTMVSTTSGFIVWAVAVVILTLFATKGPAESRKVGMAFLVLAMIVFILSNGNEFIVESEKFVQFVQSKGKTQNPGIIPAGG